MPIFEYVCETCGCQFEKLLPKPTDPSPACPECAGKNLRKLISTASIRPHGIPKGKGGFKPPKCAGPDV